MKFHPPYKLTCALAAVLKKFDSYTIFSIKKIETVFGWGYGLEVVVLLEEFEIDRIQDTILL